ncbi:MAG: matrixin family metalloprotease [Bdellovibrionales bacterium]|nr:matrixin family metalloprotease [Bdellovibrionales bacterium]
MIKLIILISIFSSAVQAYTFNNNFEAAFKDNDVKVYVDELTTCVNAGLTIYELNDLIGPAIEKYWNRVPTSKLRLKKGDFSTATTNINSGRLCAPTDQACITAAGATVIAPVKEIIIACNGLDDNFVDSNVLAVTLPNNFSGKKILGAVILINNWSTIFTTLSKADKIAVIAHEIGHAIGLGHTEENEALMFYRTVNQRKALGADDMRGVSYLYPMQFDAGGLLGGCATIQNKDGTPGAKFPYWQMGASLAVMILLSELLKLLKRSKTRSAL